MTSLKYQPLVSVIIVTRNRATCLKECLELLKQLDYPNFETIVVDSSTNEKTRQLLKVYPRVKYFRYDNGKNMAISRNIGIVQASGEIVVFIDDDSFVEKEWLTEIVNGFSDETIGGVGGRVIQENISLQTDDSSQVGRITSEGLFLGFFDYAGDKPFRVDYLVGCNMAFRREILEKLGGFDPVFSVLNDIDISMRVRRLGYYLNYNPKAILTHKMVKRELLPRERMNFESQYIYKRNNTYVLFKNDRFKWNYIKMLFYWELSELLKYVIKNLSFKSIGLIIANIWGKGMGIILSLKVRIRGEKNYLRLVPRV